MAARVLLRPKLQRRQLRYAGLLFLGLWFLGAVVWICGQQASSRRHLLGLGWMAPLVYRPPVRHGRMPLATPLEDLGPRIACLGPRQRLLSESPDDDLWYERLDHVSYPKPLMGSYGDLGLSQTWMTADGRYGPYGFNQDEAWYNRSRVDWETVDWGQLQDECAAQNAHRFPSSDAGPRFAGNDAWAKGRMEPRFTWRNQTALRPTTPGWKDFGTTRRTALVVRGFSGFAYKAEDMWHLRSLVVETALRTGGEYAVFLLVHMQDGDGSMFASRAAYEAAFEAAEIPRELESMAVLWDDGLLESWYPAVGEHRTMWQANQPLQLFALHYPEFDHYWQIELDQRFTSDAGAYLDAVASFARREPRRQALERASFPLRQQLHADYAQLRAAVAAANPGISRAWGPLSVPREIDPIGPPPPAALDWLWGVGEEADAIVTSFCAPVAGSQWVFAHYATGFAAAPDPWFCPPAVMRASRALLLALHAAQAVQGLSVASEAMLPSWALWHGLKLSYPPQPVFARGQAEGDDESEPEAWYGVAPEASPDGLGQANPQSFARRGLSWWWASDWPRQLMDGWLYGDAGVLASDELTGGVLAERRGKVYMANMALHPVKT
ncbi:hypothetical protein CDD82_1264 [Ophiocordyceps australis]|uniref:Uncharacterized protein n=1 Tax=Ophiocordyceps australis TaxID=1399860 RepID=A0A2C5XCS7_9HYPO|nr:hypothetical protein CDD82_1264 [Ophiocordyceps australis]